MAIMTLPDFQSARLSATPTGLHRHAPRLGEHTAEILLEAGYGEQEVAELREKGVISAG